MNKQFTANQLTLAEANILQMCRENNELKADVVLLREERDRAWGSECALAGRVVELEREVSMLTSDAEWRRRWHRRLGRGTAESEGKFYDRLLQRQG